MTRVDDLPIFDDIRPFLRAEPRPISTDSHSGTWYRIEIGHIPLALALRVLEAKVDCVKCGQPIHPFKARQGVSERMKEKGIYPGIYFVSTCGSASCVRQKCASEEINRLAARLLQEAA